MLITGKIAEAGAFLQVARDNGRSLGFVPTMGALHEGHKSLVERSRRENDLTSVSIFVNPKQFNDPKDLVRYPRTPQADHRMLREAGADLLFEPMADEVYAGGEATIPDFGLLERVMEGAFRPGHFKGVVAVVSRLFEIIGPHRAYFGEKDFQQLAVIREWCRISGSPVKVIGCPTLREADGLAMSSRNIHLTPVEREAAPVIYRSLVQSAPDFQKHGAAYAESRARETIEREAGFKVQYLQFVDDQTLEAVEVPAKGRTHRACIAVLTSATRLIDNIAV